jgi:membrane-bound lytic murein transglycosylase D
LKYLSLLILPILLGASLTHNSNHNKEVQILESFDIDQSFLYDTTLNRMRNGHRNAYKDNRFFEHMEEAYLFIPAIKSILTEKGVPAEFLFLAMAESNFSTRAYSRKKASGLWQFMPLTGKHYGLKINRYVDERRDLIKSTKAAANYLSYLHKRFGKWYLAAIAYNCGEGRLSKAIKKAKTDDLLVLLNRKKKYIPEESRLYIRRIVALAMMGNNEQLLMHNEYEYLLNRANAYSIATIQLPRGESLKRVSKLVGIPISMLKKLNRQLRYDFIPSYVKNYDIYIPYVKLNDFKQKYYEDKIKNIYRVHRVKSGDNLSLIGRRYGVPYKIIMDFNSLRNSKLRLNQELIIPIKNKRKKSNYKFYHMVKNGDTLESISKSYRVSIKNIKQQNHLTSSLIKVGKKLKMYE